MPRKVCVIITSHIHYGRSRRILHAIRDRKDLQLQIAIGASAILPQYGDVQKAMAEDGFTYDAKITMTLAGGTPVAMAKTTGIGITEFATAFENLEPDIVLVRGDRYEVLAAAVAAAYMNIPVAHIEGGDVTGSIDESVRHAVTKLAHIHFPTNALAAERILRMGEDPRFVQNVGCPELEGITETGETLTSEVINRLGVGAALDMEKPFLIVMHHPVTTESAENRAHTAALLESVDKSGMQALWFWPNVDAGTDDVAKAIRVYREHNPAPRMHFAKYVSPDTFTALLKRCVCIVGNSSAGIKEASYLGIPTVNVGTRQSGRLRAENVRDSSYDPADLAKTVAEQVKHGPYPQSDAYFKSNCAATIANLLATTPLYVQKRFHDVDAR